MLSRIPQTMATVILWFKTDLRLIDNEALIKAMQAGDALLPVYIFDENHYCTTRFGYKKTGNFRHKFILEALKDLDASLRKIGSGLLIKKGDPAIILSQLAKTYQVKKVFAKKEVAVEEKETEEKVTSALWQVGCELEVISTSTLYHPSDLPFSLRDIPDVFTKFRKKVEQESQVRSAFPAPKKIKSPAIAPMVLPEYPDFGLTAPHHDPRCVFAFTGGESTAQKRVHEYLFESHAIATYKETRNGLIGANYSSKLSPFLALGCISPKSIYYEIISYENQYGASNNTYWLIFELMWRDYFRFVMKKHHKKLFLKGGLKNSAPILPPHEPIKLQNWVAGKTGQPFIDANMNELAATGFMSNRGRQNVASYLCHYLKIDWRYGAAYFEQQLIDYDASSNWGNWAYLAGVGNDPREERIFNPEKQAADYDPKQQYQSLWLETS